MLKSYSYTAMSTYLRCGFAFKCRYIDNVPGKLSGDLIRGNAYHNAIGMALSEKVIYKSLPTIEQVIQCYNSTWNNLTKRKINDEDGRLVEMTNSEIDWGKETEDSMKLGGEAVIRKYYADHMASVNPREVEVWKRTTYRGIPLNGKVDVITDSLIIDHKTSSRSYSESDLETEYQSCFYAILCGREELNFELHQAIIKKEPEIKIWPVKRLASEINWVGDLIEDSWNCIQKGIFLPNPHNTYCSQAGCNYWDLCHTRTLAKVFKSNVQAVAPLDF